MQGIYQKEKEKQHRAWTRLIKGIPNKLSLSMPKVIPTILTRLSDAWHFYEQIWYVPFIWSFTWYSYWILFDVVVMNKPLAQLNLLTCIGATASAILVLAGFPIARNIQKGVAFARTGFRSKPKVSFKNGVNEINRVFKPAVTVEEGEPTRDKSMLKRLFSSDGARRETGELSRLQAKVATLEQEKENLNSRLISAENELSLTKEQLKNALNPEHVKTLENRNLDLTTALQEPQVLQSSETGWTKPVIKSTQAKPQQPSSPTSSTLPSFERTCQNGTYGETDQCLVCPNLIECTYRRNKSSKSEVDNKSRAPRLSAEEMPLEEAVAS